MAHGDSPSPEHAPTTSPKRWYVAFAAALMNALQSGGFFFTPTTLMPQIVKDFALPLSLSTVPIAVGKVAYVLLLIPGGMLVDHYGPRRCVLLGIFGLAALMTLYAAFVSSFWMLLAMHVLLATFASVSGVPVYSIFIAQWFEGGIGLAMGLVLAGYSAAGTCIPALLGPVATAVGWRIAMGCMCALLWLVALPVTFFFLHENHAPIVEEGHAGEEEEGLEELSAREEPAVVSRGLPDAGLAEHKSWTFVGFAFSYILLQYCFGCFGENVMFFLTIDRGMSLAVASLFFSALNFSAFSAKLVGGHLGDRFDRFHVASASSGLAAVGIIFLFLGSSGLDQNNIPYLTSSSFAMLMFTVLFGFGYGATFNCLYALTPIVFGKQNLGRTQSTLFGLGLAGNAVGSVLTGVLRSRYGTYQRPFLVAAMACTSNFFVFNVTRMTLGGSLEGLKELNQQQSELIMSGSYHGIDELEAAEEAARLRIGDSRQPLNSIRRSPLNSDPNLLGMPRGATTYGATYIPNRGSSPLAGSFGAPGFDAGISSSTSFVGLSRSGSRQSGTGMQIEGGYPIVRDWSHHSLRASATSSPGISRSASRTIRKSSTMEKMIESGILSASLEAVGYLGTSPMPNRVTRPLERFGSPSRDGLPSHPVSLSTVPEMSTDTKTRSGEASS
eukprot:GFKZ01002775.1.p1 GENE.GFKZ01002775.1~~GFKZ01002775.1.p1  ORF type:complete len:734 (-),score=51.91 GFKZ01002775.1:1973-3976(-)